MAASRAQIVGLLSLLGNAASIVNDVGSSQLGVGVGKKSRPAHQHLLLRREDHHHRHKQPWGQGPEGPTEVQVTNSLLGGNLTEEVEQEPTTESSTADNASTAPAVGASDDYGLFSSNSSFMDCKETRRDCFQRASEGACESAEDGPTMKKVCPVSCGQCGVPGSGFRPYFGTEGQEQDPLVPVVVKDFTDSDATLPAWAYQAVTVAGPYKLPHQPECTALARAFDGSSDHGMRKHKCAACEEPCSFRTKQAPIHTNWNFEPKLEELNIFDVAMYVEMSSVSQIAPFSMNGIHYKMNFEIQRTPKSQAFKGFVGPLARGGVAAEDSLYGQHYLQVKDTQLPSPDGMLVRGRWLALPGERVSGDIGSCVRSCVECDNYPQLRSSGLTTGVVCTVDVGIVDESSFVYRLRQSKPETSMAFQGSKYDGSEWEVTVRDVSTDAYYVVGRFFLEGASSTSGISSFMATHEHLGCAPCDAYFQSVRTAGPFVLNPKKQHFLKDAAVSAPATAQGEGGLCKLHRVVSLRGLTLLYQSGPAVWPKKALNGSKILKCR